MCRTCLDVVIVGADSTVRPTVVVVVVAVPTRDEFRADGLAGGKDCVVCPLSLLLLRLLVTTVGPRWVPSCDVVFSCPCPFVRCSAVASARVGLVLGIAVVAFGTASAVDACLCLPTAAADGGLPWRVAGW